jgi:hypothetical protein
VGADIWLDSKLAAELLLFHEGPSRVLVSAPDPAQIFETARKNSIEAIEIGVTLKSDLIVRNGTETLIRSTVHDLKQVWANGLTHLLHTPVPV